MTVLSHELIANAKQRKPYIKLYEKAVCNPDPATSDEPIDVYCVDMDSTGYSYMTLLNSIRTPEGKRIKWRFDHLDELIMVHSVCDAEGNRLFSEQTLKEDWWEKAYPGFKADLVSIARNHNGLTIVIGRTEEAEKNSEETSGSDAPSMPPSNGSDTVEPTKPLPTSE